MSTAQAVALAHSALVVMPGDVTIVADTRDNFATLSAAELATLAEKGLGALGSTEGDLVLNAAQADGVAGASMMLLSLDSVVLADAGARISALTPSRHGSTRCGHPRLKSRRASKTRVPATDPRVTSGDGHDDGAGIRGPPRRESRPR